ncbi:MAG: RMD1 family protein [Alphaproteobacteria bacterium]|nr:RMD1 family protein [Alphaproteobacteria bacterium]
MPDVSPSPEPIGALLSQGAISVRAILAGERIDTRGLEQQETLGRAPLIIRVREGGVAVLFRYGVIVLLDVVTEAEQALLERLGPLIREPFAPHESDDIRIVVRAEGDDQVDVDGTIVLKELTTERIQVVADVVAKSLILAHYESRVAHAFDRIEPMAQMLRRHGRLGISGRPLLRQIGNALLVQHNLVGRVATSEKPDLLWDHPELERLYSRLADEYELRERDRALDHQQEIILRTMETMLGLVQQRSSIRLEWYIVILIIAELIVAVYALL